MRKKGTDTIKIINYENKTILYTFGSFVNGHSDKITTLVMPRKDLCYSI